MASQLGFLIIDMRAQFIGTRVDEEPFMEVRNELFFTDLYLGDGPSLRVRDRLAKHLPKTIHLVATEWAATHPPRWPTISPRFEAASYRGTTAISSWKTCAS